MLGQYSLIESQSYNVPRSDLARMMAILLQWNKEGPKERKAIHLSEEVKTAVFNVLGTDSYCQHHRGPSASKSEKNFMVAVHLSNCLAYLIVFTPRLLPGQPFDPHFDFRRVIGEAREVLKECKGTTDGIDKLEELSEKQSHDETVITKGAKVRT